MEELLVVLVCLTLNSLLAAYEMAFVSIPKPELRRLAKAGVKESQRVLTLRENPERTLSIIQVGITLVGALAAAVGGAGAAESLEPYLILRYGMRPLTAEILSVILVVVPLTFVNVVVGELLPKSLALRNPTRILTAGTRWLILAEKVLHPVVNALERTTKWILRVFFPRPKTSLAPPQTTVEIDTLSAPHQQYVINLANIERKRICDILVPWAQVNFVRANDSIETVTAMVYNSGHTRLPVLEDEQVIGLLHTKEFLALRESGSQDWRSIVRPVIRVLTDSSALSALRLMQEKRSHLAIAYSTQDPKVGIVTLEDIIEEIVGDISDEDDDGRIRRLMASRANRKPQ